MFAKLKNYIISKMKKSHEQEQLNTFLNTDIPSAQVFKFSRTVKETIEDNECFYTMIDYFLFYDKKINFNKPNKDTRVIKLSGDHIGQMFNYRIENNSIIIDIDPQTKYYLSQKQIENSSGNMQFNTDIMPIRKINKNANSENLQSRISAHQLSLLNKKSKSFNNAQNNANNLFM